MKNYFDGELSVAVLNDVAQNAHMLVFKVCYFQKVWVSQREEHQDFTRLCFTVTCAVTLKLTKDYFAYGAAVAQLVKALRYKPAGHRFNS
jgi:hypothetical protein